MTTPSSGVIAPAESQGPATGVAAVTAGSPSREQRFFDALRRISQYESPDRLRRNADKDYGLSGEEAIEMAYENVIAEAKRAIHGQRRPKN